MTDQVAAPAAAQPSPRTEVETRGATGPGSERRPEGPERRDSARFRVIRVVLFAAWLVGVESWLAHHLGIRWDNLLAFLGVPSLLTLATFALEWLLDEDERERLKRGARAALQGRLSPVALTTLYLATAVAGLFVASVTVIPDPGDAARQITLTRLGAGAAAYVDRYDKGQTSWQRMLLINPFGGRLTVAVEGYLPAAVRVLPFVGATVSVAGDLRPLPTILFRPTVDGLETVRSGGRFVLCGPLQGRDTAELKVGEVGRDQTPNRSFRVGPARTVPPSLFPMWSLELAAGDHNQKVNAATALAWRSPQPVTLASRAKSIAPGDTLTGLIIAVNGSVVDEGVVEIGRDTFLDVRMVTSQRERTCAQ